MKTPETAFGFMPSIEANLFSVRADIPLALAAEQAACIVDAAGETARRVACSISTDDGAHLLWSAVYSLTMAHGLLESIQAALEDLEPTEAKPAAAGELSYYIAPSDHTAPGPFQWFVVNDANARVIEYGTADTWREADHLACGSIKRLEEQQAAPALAPEAKADPETMRQVWIDMAKMAADELAKLDAGESREVAK